MKIARRFPGMCHGDGIALVLLVFFAAVPARADTVRTKDGDVISGEGLSLKGGTFTLKSKALGDVAIPQDKVSTIATDHPVTVTFTNDVHMVGRIAPAGATLMQVQPDNDWDSAPFTVSALRGIEVKVGTLEEPLWQTSGNINFGLTSHYSSTDARLLHTDGKITARREKNRYNALGDANYRRENGRELANDALLKLKHDYFVNKKWFMYTSAGFGHDTGRQLNLRTDVGTGAGYQIVDTPRAAVAVEGGPSYVITDFSGSGSDASYPALRWAADLRYDPIIKKLSLFHYEELLSAVTSADGVLLQTRTGLRYVLIDGLTASAQIKFNWDSRPAPGESESDTTYLVTLGYSW